MAKVTPGMRRPRYRDPRKLNLTIRLVAPRDTPPAVLIDALERSIRFEQVQEPLQAIHWCDWTKGEPSGPIARGRYTPPELWTALKDFYAAITHPNTRLRVGRPEA